MENAYNICRSYAKFGVCTAPICMYAHPGEVENEQSQFDPDFYDWYYYYMAHPEMYQGLVNEQMFQQFHIQEDWVTKLMSGSVPYFPQYFPHS